MFMGFAVVYSHPTTAGQSKQVFQEMLPQIFVSISCTTIFIHAYIVMVSATIHSASENLNGWIVLISLSPQY